MFTRATQCVWDVLDPPVSVFSLPLYRHPFFYIHSLTLSLLSYNKQPSVFKDKSFLFFQIPQPFSINVVFVFRCSSSTTNMSTWLPRFRTRRDRYIWYWISTSPTTVSELTLPLILMVITHRWLSHLWLLFQVRLGGYIVNLCDFYSYWLTHTDLRKERMDS